VSDTGGVPVKEKPEPPSLGTGMRKPEVDGWARGETDQAYSALIDPMREIPDDLQVDAEQLLKDSKVDEVLARLDRELVGLTAVKERIREIAALLLVDRLRRSLSLEAEAPTLHMSFTGNPGTGKTTVAMRMGQILYQLGYVRKGHLVVAGRDDLVGQYVGHTAPKTREVLKRAMGGVLFIDEAYNIYRLDNERDYGQETVEVLLQVMESERQNVVVVMAGYRDKMERFFNDVPGISSRIAFHIDFPDYRLDELMDIARLMLQQQQYRFSPEAEKTFEHYLKRRLDQPRFANGRSVRNALERARMRHAVRLFDQGTKQRSLTKGDLVTIEADDILKSRVFETDAAGKA
jgi:probable Rubsico expression protein CbbX